MSIRKHAVAEKAAFHLLDAAERPMFVTKVVNIDGVDTEVPDETKPMRVWLYSPGSKQFAKALVDRNNRIIARMGAKGKNVPLTVEESVKERSVYLSECTHSWENVELDDKQGHELSMAVYGDMSLGFIADQNAKRLGDWRDFSKDSQAT